jgi:hypothetical protein
MGENDGIFIKIVVVVNTFLMVLLNVKSLGLVEITILPDNNQ